MRSLEHEFVHVHGGNEQKAYRKSCQIQAQQECWKCSMTQEEMQKKIDQCVKDGVPKSTGPTNKATIREGCKKLCDKYIAER